MMQKLEGEFAEWYNLRKRRSGAYWGDRYHCTMVEGSTYAWNCMKYIDMNMVRAGVVNHPSRWRWCGYDELSGKRQRYRLIDRDCVVKWQGNMKWESFAEAYSSAIDEEIARRNFQRNPIWTESIAVGSRSFIQAIRDQISNRVRLEQEETEDGLWVIREEPVVYGSSRGR
jgi:putative transposase